VDLAQDVDVPRSVSQVRNLSGVKVLPSSPTDEVVNQKRDRMTDRGRGP
jgi:hypothetical protein